MRLKISVSSVCALFLAAHLFVPTIRPDAVSFGLIVIALLPWFQPLIKSLELPGGLKIELQDVKSATDKLSEGAVPIAGKESADDGAGGASLSFVMKVSDEDPNLALVALRIELEKRLVEIAKLAGVLVEGRSATSLLRELARREAIPEPAAQGQEFHPSPIAFHSNHEFRWRCPRDQRRACALL